MGKKGDVMLQRSHWSIQKLTISVTIKRTFTICTNNDVMHYITHHHTGTNSRPSTPSTPKYGTRTPGEIVASALRNRTRPPSGVLRKAIGMYQENRRQSQRVRKSLQENRPRSCFIEELEETEEKALLEVEEEKERSSTSAGGWSMHDSNRDDHYRMYYGMTNDHYHILIR